VAALWRWVVRLWWGCLVWVLDHDRGGALVSGGHGLDHEECALGVLRSLFVSRRNALGGFAPCSLYREVAF